MAGVSLATAAVLTVAPAAAAATAAHEAVVAAALTRTQIQNLVQWSGERAQVLYTRLATSPVVDRVLYVTADVDLANQAGSNRALYIAKIPVLLFKDLVAKGFIKPEMTRMNGVVGQAWRLEPEAMTILAEYFKVANGG